jgi:glycosyltransferase involved in cell wall biosynthesis
MEEELDGVKVIRLPSWNMLNGTFPVPKPFIGKLPQHSDIVITQTRFFVTSFLGALYARWKGIPLIHVERGSRHSITSNKAIGSLAMIVDHTLGRIVIRSARVSIGVSQAAGDFADHLGGRHTRIIPNGIDLRIPLWERSPDICFVGRLIYAKGVQDLIQSFEAVGNEYSNARLIIVGDGNYKQDLEQQANKSKHRSRIVFYGTQNHDSAMRILFQCTVFVNPSYSEGLPTSVMEAASIGKPIIATDVGGTWEIITDSVSGVLYEPGNIPQLTKALLAILSDTASARRLGIAAIKSTREKFSWEPIVDQYEKMLKEVSGK